jgi:hypothetical protein
MLDPVETFDHGRVHVAIHYDQHATDPRHEFDHMGTIVGWKHPRYCLGDEQASTDYRSPSELLADRDARVALPIHAQPDGRLVTSEAGDEEALENSDGAIYVAAEVLRREYSLKRVSSGAIQKAIGVLAGEVAEYGAYLSGQVFGFVITDDDGDHLDSCWGYYGLSWCESAAREAADYGNQLVERELRERYALACRGVLTVPA